MLEAQRVFPDEHRGKILDGAHHGARLPFERTFAPAEQARLVGFHFAENPVSHLGVHHNGFDICDFHHSGIPRSFTAVFDIFWLQVFAKADLAQISQRAERISFSNFMPWSRYLGFRPSTYPWP